MKGIGGNKIAVLQVSAATSNEIGEQAQHWTDAATLRGWLDLSGSDARQDMYTAYNAKIQQSTHVFVAEYAQLPGGISAENCRLICGGKRYDVLLIDNPMELCAQLEIYLKYVGGQEMGQEVGQKMEMGNEQRSL